MRRGELATIHLLCILEIKSDPDEQIRSMVLGTRCCWTSSSHRTRAKSKTVHLYYGHVSFISQADYGADYSIGCITTPKDFAVAGTAQDKLYGMAEGLWEPDLVGHEPVSGIFVDQ